jgi:predicted lipid-binding transport protein (Tim44 family)
VRRLGALALVLFLLSTIPAAASGLDDMGSEQQTEGYGKMFGYVCAVAALGIAIIGGVQIAKQMAAENRRGKKTGIMQEQILDDIPKPKTKRALYLGEKVPDWKLANRLPATEAALEMLAKKDDWFDPPYLIKLATAAFKGVKAAIEGKSTKKIAERLTDEHLEELRGEIAKLKKRGETRVLSSLEVVDVEIVHFEAPASQAKHTFVALISAKSKDFIRDVKTKEVLRGDKKLYAYQEFWKFRRTPERWLVERVYASGDMDRVIGPKNVLTEADLAKFTKTADEAYLREFLQYEDRR